MIIPFEECIHVPNTDKFVHLLKKLSVIPTGTNAYTRFLSIRTRHNFFIRVAACTKFKGDPNITTGTLLEIAKPCKIKFSFKDLFSRPMSPKKIQAFSAAHNTVTLTSSMKKGLFLAFIFRKRFRLNSYFNLKSIAWHAGYHLKVTASGRYYLGRRTPVFDKITSVHQIQGRTKYVFFRDIVSFINYNSFIIKIR